VTATPARARCDASAWGREVFVVEDLVEVEILG
jgi:hypothetical protein